MSVLQVVRTYFRHASYSLGFPPALPSPGDARGLPARRDASDDEDMDPIRAVGAEHDRLLDVAGARWARDQIDGARERASLAAQQRECVLHAGHDAVGPD